MLGFDGIALQSWQATQVAADAGTALAVAALSAALGIEGVCSLKCLASVFRSVLATAATKRMKTTPVPRPPAG